MMVSLANQKCAKLLGKHAETCACVHAGSGKAVFKTADSRVLRSQALLLQGKTPEALSELDSVIQEFPNCARAFYERGLLRCAALTPQARLTAVLTTS